MHNTRGRRKSSAERRVGGERRSNWPEIVAQSKGTSWLLAGRRRVEFLKRRGDSADRRVHDRRDIKHDKRTGERRNNSKWQAPPIILSELPPDVLDAHFASGDHRRKPVGSNGNTGPTQKYFPKTHKAKAEDEDMNPSPFDATFPGWRRSVSSAWRTIKKAVRDSSEK